MPKKLKKSDFYRKRLEVSERATPTEESVRTIKDKDAPIGDRIKAALRWLITIGGEGTEAEKEWIRKNIQLHEEIEAGRGPTHWRLHGREHYTPEGITTSLFQYGMGGVDKGLLKGGIFRKEEPHPDKDRAENYLLDKIERLGEIMQGAKKFDGMEDEFMSRVIRALGAWTIQTRVKGAKGNWPAARYDKKTVEDLKEEFHLLWGPIFATAYSYYPETVPDLVGMYQSMAKEGELPKDFSEEILSDWLAFRYEQATVDKATPVESTHLELARTPRVSTSGTYIPIDPRVLAEFDRLLQREGAPVRKPGTDIRMEEHDFGYAGDTYRYFQERLGRMYDAYKRKKGQKLER